MSKKYDLGLGVKLSISESISILTNEENRGEDQLWLK